MSEPRLAFLAAETEAARGARARLADRYGETDPETADAIVALGGDGSGGGEKGGGQQRGEETLHLVTVPIEKAARNQGARLER